MELKPFNHLYNHYYYQLLIVPYGIETVSTTAKETDGTAFNRTLWN